MNVYECVSAVSADLARAGVSKDSKNAQQGYNFRGIDAMYNALAPLLSKHGLVILPRTMTRDVVERQTKSGSALFYVTVEVEFDFVSAKDGSKHVVKTYGEAMDSADKATNKAMSAAYKYAVMQAFCIPTSGDNDADATTHDVAACSRQNTPQRDAPPPDVHRHIRDVADRCIALHAAAVVRAEKDSDMSGFWDLHDAAATVTGEDRVILWDMLKQHSAVRSSIKEYAGYAAAEKAKAAA